MKPFQYEKNNVRAGSYARWLSTSLRDMGKWTGMLFVLLLLGEESMAQATCACKEYVYLNEPNAQSILKFEVNSATIPLTEILVGGRHWYPGNYVTNTQGMDAPHGIAGDNQGYLYIGSTGTNASKIKRFSCDGVVTDTVGANSFAIANTGQKQNLFTIGNLLFNNDQGGPNIWNTCTGAYVGKVILNDINGNPMPTVQPSGQPLPNLWGLSYNATTGMIYATSRHGGNPNVPASRRHLVWAFTRAQMETALANGTGINPILSAGPVGVIPSAGDKFTPNTPESLFGITSDNLGNMYIVKSSVDSNNLVTAVNSYILKYNAAGEFVSRSPIDNFTGKTVSNNYGYRYGIGIAYSQNTNRLYVSNFTDNLDEDCISVFDAGSMAYLGVGAPNPGIPATDDRGKAIGIIRECCPSLAANTSVTLYNVKAGDRHVLPDLAGTLCNGVVCGGTWAQNPANTGFTYDPCDNSITINTPDLCGSFTLTGNNAQCGPYSLTLQVCTQSPRDYGDLPSGYPVTSAQNGAAHEVPTTPVVYLGTSVDTETDGQPDPDAGELNGGDDGTGTPDDENGVTEPTMIFAGQPAVFNVAVVTNATAYLYGFIDWNNDKDFADAGEVANTTVTASGQATLTFNVPAGAVIGQDLGARFRLGTVQSEVSQATGLAMDGEVEDYLVQVKGVDYGDLPSGYPVTSAQNGAVHGVPTTPAVYLGTSVDTETDGQPDPDAGELNGGDDGTGTPDDENGVTEPTMIFAGQPAVFNVAVVTNATAYLYGFIDWNNDKDFADAGEVANTTVTASGSATLTFNVPAGAVIGQDLGARFRLGTVQSEVSQATGLAMDGEVEDYLVQVMMMTLALDYGDLPDTYNTSGSDSPPRHAISADLMLGASVDSEADGSPDPMAGSMGGGDDGSTSTQTFGTSTPAGDDENGVMLATPMVPGSTASFMVNAVNNTSTAAVLQAWVDFNGNGTFEGNEQLTTGSFSPGGATVPVGGLNGAKLSFTVPSVASFYLGNAMVRFRLSPNGGLSPNSQTGTPPMGEIEDYKFPLGQIGNLVFEDRNYDGTQTAGEPGIDGVGVMLTWAGPNGTIGDGDDAMYQTVTGATSGQQAGEYYFSGLIAGNYKLKFSTPANMKPTWGNTGPQANGGVSDSDGSVSGSDLSMAMETFTIADVTALPVNETGLGDAAPGAVGSFPDAQTDETHDQGFHFGSPMSIGSTVFADVNDDGLQSTTDPLEQGISNVPVSLYYDANRDGVISGSEATTPVLTTTTDAFGNYIFAGLPEGLYQVGILPPGAAPVSSSGASGDDGVDGNDNGIQPGGSGTPILSSPILLAAGTEPATETGQGGGQDNTSDANGDMTVDFGLIPAMSIGSTVFYDVNNDGVQSGVQETGISGVAVQLLFDTNRNGIIDATEQVPVRSVVTDALGNYYFGTLPEGKYQVVVPSPDPLAPTSSAGQNTVPHLDGTDDGAQTGGAGGPVASPVVMLMSGGEPTAAAESNQGGNQDDANDANGNMTIDFGFVPAGTFSINPVTFEGFANRLMDVYCVGEIGQRLPDTAYTTGDVKVSGRWFLVTGSTLPVVGTPYPTASLRSVYRVDTDTAGHVGGHNASDSLYSYVFLTTSSGSGYPLYVHTVRIKGTGSCTGSNAPTAPTMEQPTASQGWAAGAAAGSGADQATASASTDYEVDVCATAGDGWLELPRLTPHGAWYIETGGDIRFDDSTNTDTMVQYYTRLGMRTRPNFFNLPLISDQNLLQKVPVGTVGTSTTLYYINESHQPSSTSFGAAGYVTRLTVDWVNTGCQTPLFPSLRIASNPAFTDSTFVYCANTNFTLPTTTSTGVTGRWYINSDGATTTPLLTNADSLAFTNSDGSGVYTICRPVGVDTFVFVPSTGSGLSVKKLVGIAIPSTPSFEKTWGTTGVSADQVGTFWEKTGDCEPKNATPKSGASYDLCEGTAFPLSDSSDVHLDANNPLNYNYPDSAFVGKWFHNNVPMSAVTTGANTLAQQTYHYRAAKYVLDFHNGVSYATVEIDSAYFRDNTNPSGQYGACWSPLSVNFRIHPNHPEFANMQQTYCEGETPAALPATSSNGVAGTWSPATINTATVGATTYTFTPDASQHPSCVQGHSVTIVVTRKSTPVFNDTTVCVGSGALSLSTTSRDGIAGTWNTSGVNTSVVGTYTATFTPTVSGANAGNCYGNATITVRVAAAVAVSCPSSVNITLDPESCTKSLTFDALQMNGCADATHKIIVQDNNPLNGAVIDCPGTWTYGIFTKADNQLVCWGTVNAEDKSGPLLVGFYRGAGDVNGACRSYATYTSAWHSAPWTTPPTSTVGNASQRYGVIDGDGATAGQQPVSQWTSELMCTDVNKVLNTAASWDGRTANYAYYTGRPDFADGCNKTSGGPDFGSPTVGNLTNGSCACTDTLKANDQIVYYPCSASGANNDILDGYWATITRTFTSTDCRGNVSTVSQTINFRRPAIADFANGAEQDGIFEGDTRQMPAVVVLDSTGCNNFDKAEMVRRLKAGQYYNTAALQEDRLVDDLQPKYIFDDLYSCDANERYSYFAEAVGTGNYNNQMSFTGNNWGATASAAGTVSKRLECNYSFDIEEVTQFPVCNGGMKLQVEVTAFDWCTGKRNVMDNILLKWTDAVKPSIVPSAAADRANNTTGAPGADNVHDKPIIISTGALDCTASFGIDIASLESFFGIDVSDNCTPDNLIDLNVQVQSCVYPTTSGIVTGAQEFRTVQYRTMVANGRNMVMGVPVGQHRLTITAFDKCYNQWTRSFDFTVLDRTAPVMKCTDQLTVTIANSSTSGPTNQFGGYGQTHPLTGYAVKGYAKVLVNEINRGSSDNCGMDWVRVRREIDPTDAADVAFFVAAGYDSNGDGTISTADGVDWNSDGDINDLMEKFSTNNTGQMMTPALDFVEFHCGDLTDQGGVMIELWGRDKETNILTCSGSNLPTTPVTSGGNTNFCWMNIVVEDKVAPTFTRPSDARITCYNREALDTLRKAASVSGGIDITSSTYKWIETNIFVPQGEGRFIVNSGDDCNALTVKAAVNVVGINNCDSSGNVTITYTATKPNVQSGNATTTTVNVPVVDQRGVSQATATIRVRRVHEYNLRFPQDVSVLCTSGQITTRDTSNVADGGELGCDILSVNVTDKRYNGAVNASGTPVADCYRIYRTFTVVNWCQYDDRCGEPMQWAVIVPRDPANNNGNYNSTSAGNATGSTVANSGVNVLVRDLNANASASTTAATRIYFEDASKNLTPETSELVSSFTYNNSQNAPCSSVDASKQQFAWMYTQYLYVTDRTAPEATINAATGTSIRKDNCLAPVSITFTATDACAGATGTESQNNTSANPSIAIERVRLRTYTSAYQGSASPSPVNSFQANEQASTIADVPGTQVSPSQALNLGTKNGGAWTYSANLARGWYGLIVVVRDDCGNLSTQKELTFRVVDDQPTSPICYNGLSTDLMTTPAGGRMEVWASDFIAERKVYDCTGTGVAEPSNAALKQLEKYWVVKDDNGDGNFDAADGLAAATNAQGLAIFVPTGAANNSVIFDCDDLGDVAVRLYTQDEAGNWAWCETFAKITDARGVCPSGPGTQSAAVAGAIATESNLNVEGVEVSLSGDATMSYATNVNGQYSFAGLRKGYDYTVTPQLDKNYLNGVSTFDLVLITKHILGVQPLNSPYKLIAADVNNSKSVTTLDLIQLRKLILNIDTKFANNTSWRFVDSSFKFANAANPWATQFPEVANLNDVAADVRANFVAVKIGDVNGNAVASSQVRTNGTFGLNVAEQALKAGNEYTVVFSGDLSQVEGYQFTLALDGNAVELVNLEAGIAVEENFGIFATEGVVTASWNGEAGNGNLFSLVVRAKADANLSEVLNLNSRYTAAEAYNKAGEQLNVALNFTGGQPVAAGFELKQNTPNPFAGETVVGFNLPVAGDATLTIQDVTGRTLRVIKGAYAQGYNQVILKSNDLKATGVLYYTLESGAFTATRKMVILE